MLDIVTLIWQWLVIVGIVSREDVAAGCGDDGGGVTMAGTGAGRSSRSAPRRWTKARKARFLEQFEELLDVKKAAKAVGMTAAKAYDCRDRDSAFARAWNQALERSYDAVELSLIQQGLNGTRRTEAVRKGTGASSEPVKWVHSFSPAVALRLLLAHRASVAALRKPREALVENEDVIGQVQARMDVMRARHGLTVLDLDDHDGPDGAE